MNDETLTNTNNSSVDQAAEQPLTDKQNLPVQDGGIPQDSQAVESGAVDALGMENIEVKFEKGNFSQIEALPMTISTAVNAITKTLVPLIEVALIELTGSSQKYKRTFAQITPSFDQNGQIHLEFNIQYTVAGYIGTDFEYKDLQDDSTYIFNRVAPANIKLSKCEIDTSNGLITIMGGI